MFSVIEKHPQSLAECYVCGVKATHETRYEGTMRTNFGWSNGTVVEIPMSAGINHCDDAGHTQNAMIYMQGKYGG